MVGKPKFEYGQYVQFYLDDKLVYGTIEVIDRFGTFFDDSDVSYDIFIYNGKERILVKHVKETGVELDTRKKVFISQPMKGLSKIDILNEREEFIENHPEIFEGVNILDTVFEGHPNYDTNEPVYYLGKSIEILADADMVVFMPGAIDSRGCSIEYFVADKYEIPHIVY